MSSGGVPARHRDIETEELIEDQQHKIRELERQHTQLKEKLLVARQQLMGPGGGGMHQHTQQHYKGTTGGGMQVGQGLGQQQRKTHSRYTYRT